MLTTSVGVLEVCAGGRDIDWCAADVRVIDVEVSVSLEIDGDGRRMQFKLCLRNLVGDGRREETSELAVSTWVCAGGGRVLVVSYSLSSAPD
jgi:hypothetical protein